MNDELKSLIEDAAKLLGCHDVMSNERCVMVQWSPTMRGYTLFNPLDPERGDLWKVASAAKVVISYYDGWVRWVSGGKHGQEHFLCDNYPSLALAILRAASAVWKARGE